MVTNGTSASQRPKLCNTGIDALVDAITVSEEVGVAKPEPEIFRHALAAIDADPATTLFVGDNPAADIGGAKALGLLAAWVHLGRDWELATPRPDYVIGAVWELDALLDSATRA